jgi:hypothetical protein
LNRFKIQERFKFEFVPEFVTCNPEEFEVGLKIKVIPYVSNCGTAKFGKFWISGRSLIQILKIFL